MIEILPTVVPSTYADVGACADRWRGIAPALQIDGADGVFAPNTTWLCEESRQLPPEMYYEAHIMVKDAKTIGQRFIRAGVSRMIGHVEAFTSVTEGLDTLALWRNAGAKEVGLGILYETPIEALAPYITSIDCVIAMTITAIGKQGIPFEPQSIERVAHIHAQYPAMRLTVDGGVSEKNIADLSRAGATRFSVGSALAKSENPRKSYAHLMELATNA